MRRALPTAAVLAFFLGPLAWQVLTSFWPEPELTRPLPHALTLANYAGLGGSFARAVVNSLLVAAGTTAVCLAVGASAAFAIAKLEFRGRSLLLGGARHQRDPGFHLFLERAALRALLHLDSVETDHPGRHRALRGRARRAVGPDRRRLGGRDRPAGPAHARLPAPHRGRPDRGRCEGVGDLTRPRRCPGRRLPARAPPL